jgi:hypothetical protein
MTALRRNPRRRARGTNKARWWESRDLGPARPSSPCPRAAAFARLVILLIGGYLLFAHGCHGDEDNELWAGLVRGLSALTAP